MFAEVFRVLKAGGDSVISDPPPFRAVDPFHAAILERDNDHREEPYFTETAWRRRKSASWTWSSTRSVR